MRDILTALAGAVVLVLVAALAVPPFIDWSAHRAPIDRTLAESLGAGARSEGDIALRLLPSPHLRLARLRLGSDDGPSIDAEAVDAEIALAPLLKGEVRFVQTVIERAALTLPVAGEALRLPRDRAAMRRDVVIDDLRIRRLSVATVRAGEPAQARIDVENVRLRAPALAGPWLIDGTAKGSPFNIATSAASADGGISVKFTGGGDTAPRLEADARIALKPEPGAEAGQRGVVPEAEGSARLTVGPPVQPAGATLPFTLSAKFESRGPVLTAKAVELELDPGGKAARLSGSGRLDLRDARLGLNLRTRRLDLDGLLLSSGGRALLAQGLSSGALTPPTMLDLDLSAESVALGLDDWANVAFRGTFDRSGGLVLRRFEGTAPGAASVAATGEIELSAAARFTGHIDIAARNSEGLGRYLGRLGAEESVATILDGRPFELGTDLSAAGTDLSLRNLRLALGEAQVTGNARYLPAGASGRGRLEAQLAASGLDIAELPPVSRLMAGLHRHDLGLTLKARGVRYGPAGVNSSNGTIAVNLQSDGASLVVDGLDIADLAGASAQLAGRIAPDGSGRIEGRVAAAKAAPLLALLERGFLPEARRLPQSFREAGLALALTLERESGEADSLRATAKGRAGEGDLDLTLLTRFGRIDRIEAALATQRTGRWFGRDDIAGLRQPGRLRLTGSRPSAEGEQDGTPPLSLGIEGDLAGLTLATTRPLLLGALDEPPGGGEIRVEARDLAPFLSLAGSAGTGPAPMPASLAVVLSRRGAAAHADVAGRVSDTDLSASLDRGSDGALAGTATLGRLSLPALAAATLLPTGADGRFVPAPRQPQASIGLKVGRLDLGRGLVAEAASLTLVREADTLALRDLTAGLAGGRIGGSVTLARPGAAASISGEGRLDGVDLAGLIGAGPVAGRLSAALRFGATGATLAALADDLSGNGEMRLTDLALPGAEAGALDRALAKALAEDDPLREGRLQALVSEELTAGPLRAKGPVSSPVTVSGGALRTGVLGVDLGPARWNGTLQVDLRARTLDARGTLTALAGPKGWSGAAPAIQLGFAGPLSAPERRLDTAPLTTGLAALVLQRELEKIELFDADQSERQRRRARIEMDRARAAAEDAARLARIKAAEEAARQARQREAEEAARQARQREAEEAARRARIEVEPPTVPEAQPLDITPPSARP